MAKAPTWFRPRNLLVLQCILIGIVIWLGILQRYVFYFPARFDVGFLSDKADRFYSTLYGLGFYVHVVSSPIALLVGFPLLFQAVVQRMPRVHRALGRVYVGLVLAMVVPGGLIMALGTTWGWNVTLCFVLLAIVTWVCTFQAVREARARRFQSHKVWVHRSYALMCSAIVLRVLGIAIHTLGGTELISYNVYAWLSWLLPLFALEWSCSPRGQVKVKRLLTHQRSETAKH